MSSKKSQLIKKIGIGIGVGLLLFLGALLLVPTLFKKQIGDKIQQVANEKLTAKLHFADYDLSFFRHFPKLSVSLEQLSIIGKEEFEGDTLLYVPDFELALNVSSLLSDKMEIYGIYLKEPLVKVRVLKNGKANYDIYQSEPETQTETPSDTAAFQIGLEKWVVEKANIFYQDDTAKITAKIQNLTHEGSGEIMSALYDLETKTEIEALFLEMDKSVYLANRPLSADMVMAMDMNNMKFSFKENRFKISDFSFGFDGFVRLPNEKVGEKAMELDLTFAAQETTFKSLLSLVPAVFLKGYEDLKAEGKVAFEGFAKGELDTEAEKYPTFSLKLLVEKARVQYPNLPAAIENINLDAQISNNTPNLENTLTDLRQFSLNFGGANKNPVSGRAKIVGLSTYDIDALVKAEVNLGEISQFYPLDSLELKGLYKLNLLAKGKYDEATAQIPTLDAQMSLQNGYAKSLAYPIPIENIEVVAQAKNTTGKMENLSVLLEKITFAMENKPFEVSGNTEGIENLSYNLKAKGSIDLEKMLKIFPIEGMSLKGLLDADIQTQGNLAALEAEAYEKLPTQGRMSVKNLEYLSTDLPQGLRISQADLTFTPKEMKLNQFDGFLGKSDIKLQGALYNYLAYGLSMAGLKEGTAILRGNMTLQSKVFDTNEWMSEEENSTATAQNTANGSTASQADSVSGVVEVPKDLDFTFQAQIEKVLYDNLTLKNAQGTVRIKDGEINFTPMTFEAAGGKFTMGGSYNTQDLEKPLFAFNIDIAEANIGEAFTAFSTLQTFAPIMQHLEGTFSLQNFQLAGVLNQDLMPDFTTLSGQGVMRVIDAAFKDNLPAVEAISNFTSIQKIRNSQFKDLIVKTKIENGRLKTEPFEVALAQYKVGLAGDVGADGSLQYKVLLDVPKEEVVSKLNGWTGLNANDIKGERVQLNFNLAGTYQKPILTLDKKSTQDLIKAQAGNALQNLVSDLFGGNKSATDSTTQKSDSTQKAAPNETLKDKVEEKANDVKNKVKDKLRGLGGKK
ncbi:AsmA-like C-terminal region-containing protein [Hugenholtzia roseola]|uniref:AsmA-like C-terminal region-containing protein n=1 Tax=Hugenholtzia roseola TaxID=1002 RepID=UPI00041FAF14|nr:AsmA-like C-terminal region-containing protein [Hugenholtzia roseola]